MAAYPPPLIQSDIFNSALFSEATTAVVSSGNPSPTTEYVEFPEPQGELTFLNGTGVRTTISASAVTLFQNIGISEDGVGFNATGIAYQPPDAAPVAITWNNLATKVEAIAAITQASDATTLNVNNSIQIQNGETQSSPTQYIIIKSDNSGNRISLDGSYGEVGQVILSGGENGSLSWGAGGGGGSQSLQEVLDVSNVATNTNIVSSTNTFFTTTISGTGVSMLDATNGAYDFQSNSISYAANTVSNTKADGFFLYEEYSNVATNQSTVLQHQDGFVGAPPNVPNVVAKCEITTEKVELNSYVDNVATAISSLSSNGLTMSVSDPADPLNTVFVVGLEQNALTYRDANTPTNQSGMSSGGFNVFVEDPEDPGQPFPSVSIDAYGGVTTTNPDNQTENSNISPQGLSTTTTDTESGNVNSAQLTNGGLSISLSNNDFPENPTPASSLDIGSVSIIEDTNSANDSKSTVLSQHNLNYQQVYLGESIDILQMGSNILTMKNVGAVQKDLVELQNFEDIRGLLNLRSTENINVITLSNSALTFSADDGDNWTINQSTDTFNNLTITQTGTAGYMDLNFNELLIRGGAGTSGQVLTSGGTNGAFTWQTPSSGWVGTATSNLNMGTYDITSSSGTLDISATNIQITGQANFVSPPHIPDPILGNDAASKGYVDSLVGQYSGGLNLFLNYSQTSGDFPTYKVLSQTISSAVGQEVDITFTSGTQEVARFITEPLGITELPAGLWDAFIYGSVSGQGGDVHYSFQLNKVTSAGVSTPIATSGISPDVNSSPNNNPTSYSMIAPITAPVVLALTDRLAFILSVTKTNGGEVTLRTFFEGSYYSFVQSTLNAGTTLLGSNNNWVGTNNFAINPTTPSKTTPANTDIINYADIQRLSTPIVSTLEYYISTLSPYFQYPPAPPTAALINAYQYYGWYFINAVVARQISWYFAPDYQMTVGDVKGLYMNYFNITTTSNDDLPFISIYTKPTGTNDAIPGFAHSVATYIANFTPLAASPYCSFMNISGTQQDPFPYGHILGDMILSPVAPNPRGEYLPTEEVLAVAVGSNSGSSVNQVAFIMSKVGICLEQGNQELILNPQNILEQPTLSTVLALGNTAGSQSITGVNNLSATSVTTPTLTNGAATLTVGTIGQITNIVGTLQNNGAELPAYISSSGVASGSIDMNSNSITECNSLDSVSALTLGGTNALGVNVGRSAQTTDLLGNVRVNGSSGTSGQVLTSTGATTAPTFQALPTPYISSGGVSSGSIDMNSNFLTEVGGLDASGVLAIGQAQASLGVSIGRATQTTNLNGNVQFNSSSGASGEVLTSTGASTAPTFQALPTPYISTSGVASGAINMNTNAITSCPRLDSASALALGNTTATGVSVGRLTQTTDLVGNVRINGSSGLSGQALISTGASTAPTWQPLAVNTTYYQSIDTSVTTGGGSSLRAKLTFNVPTSTATYLFSFSAIGGPDNASGVGGQTFISFTYEKGTSTSFTGSRNFIGNAAANVALTNQTSISAVVNGPTGTYNALSGQRIYTVSSGTSFVAGDYSFCLLVYNVGPANIRQMTFSAIQLTA